MIDLARQWPRAKQWSLRLAEFGSVQGVVQLFLAVAGLLIVRTLSKPEYALFAIANSMQTTGHVLADLGIGIGVRSIGGRVWQDRQRFGQLLNTALGLRRRFALLSLSVTVPVAAWMLWRNGAGLGTTIGLCVAVVAAVIPLLGCSAWTVCLQLHGEYRRIQKLDLASAAMRLVFLGGLAFTWMNAVLTALVGVVGNWFQMLFQRRWASEKADPRATCNQDDHQELVKLSRKAIPNCLFFCFQGQVTFLILTLVGNSTGIADVTALGRLAALFAVFSITFANVVGPSFTRCQDEARLPKLYLLLVGITVLVLTPLTLVSWLFPRPFLWLLGGKYASLEQECVWVVAAGCIGQIGGAMWNLNSSKAWLKVVLSSSVVTTLGVQVVAACFLDLRQFHNVLVFNLITATIPIPLCAIDAFLGFRGRHGNRVEADASQRASGSLRVASLSSGADTLSS